MESIPPPLEPVISRSRWRIHMMLITAYVLAVGLLGFANKGARSAMLSKTAGGLLSACALELVVFGLVFGLACVASRPTRDDLLLRWRGRFKPIFLGAGYSLALRLAVGLLAAAIGIGLLVTRIMSPESLQEFLSSNRPDVERLIDVRAMRNNPAYYWLTLTVVSFVVAGLREELWRSAFLAGMKALWPRRFGSQGGQIVAVVICAMIFGFGHLAMGWLAVCITGFLGIGLGLIMVFHRSIWPAVIAHGFFDATSMALLPWVLGHATKM